MEYFVRNLIPSQSWLDVPWEDSFKFVHAKWDTKEAVWRVCVRCAFRLSNCSPARSDNTVFRNSSCHSPSSTQRFLEREVCIALVWFQMSFRCAFIEVVQFFRKLSCLTQNPLRNSFTSIKFCSLCWACSYGEPLYVFEWPRRTKRSTRD